MRNYINIKNQENIFNIPNIQKNLKKNLYKVVPCKLIRKEVFT